MLSLSRKELLSKVRMMVPPMLEKFHKGQLGRVAVIGGSQDYTGAPYFSAMASAKLGNSFSQDPLPRAQDAYLMLSSPPRPFRRRYGISIQPHHPTQSPNLQIQSHVICEPTAAQVIKTYSPNLMVHPLMQQSSSSLSASASTIAAPIIDMLPRLHVLVIGPGLGRDPLMQDTIACVVAEARKRNVPMVLDADALLLVQKRPELVKGYRECILTPNVVEFGRLAAAFGVEVGGDAGEGCAALARALGGVCVVRKGRVDWVSDGEKVLVSEGEGGRKRAGGQGDTLTGSLGTLLAWREAYLEGLWEVEGTLGREELLMLAAWGGSAITRECSRLAFLKCGRSLQASDLTEQVSVAFENLIGEKEESKL